MKNDLRARLERLESYMAWSGRRMAHECKLSTQTLNRAKARNSALDHDTAVKIAKRLPGLKLAWLMFGEGDWGLGPGSSPPESEGEHDSRAIEERAEGLRQTRTVPPGRPRKQVRTA